MLKLKPSMRMKRRYLLIEAKNKEVIEKAILDYIGILGWAKAAPIFVNGNEKIILAITRESIDQIRAAFELCTEDIKILKVSGTLKGLGIKFNK